MFQWLRKLLGRESEPVSAATDYDPVYGLPQHAVEDWLAHNPRLKKEYAVPQWLDRNRPLSKEQEAARGHAMR
jgi:hypothetical protein